MKLRTTFYAESSDAHPQIPANPSADFASLTDARETAFEDANKPDMRAHLIIIETVDDGSVNERWVRDGASETFVASDRRVIGTRSTSGRTQRVTGSRLPAAGMTAAAALQQIGAYSISRTRDGGLAEGRVVTVQTGRTSADECSHRNSRTTLAGLIVQS
jgi:hypothetical protein